MAIRYNGNPAIVLEVQHRTPIVSDPRVRGYQSGQVVSTADGGYFFAARPDLDTIVSRIDSALVENIDVEAYGAMMKLKQLAVISVPEPRLIVIQPFDASTVVCRFGLFTVPLILPWPTQASGAKLVPVTGVQ